MASSSLQARIYLIVGKIGPDLSFRLHRGGKRLSVYFFLHIILGMLLFPEADHQHFMLEVKPYLKLVGGHSGNSN